MAGGTWIDQNKTRPGVYINYKSKPASLAQMGERGTVAIAHVCDWYERGKFYTIESVEDTAKLGHYISDPEMLFVRQILKGSNRTAGAKKILVYSLNTTATAAVKASATLGNLTATAKWEGEQGNNISVKIDAVDTSFAVKTLYKGDEVDSQTVASISELTNNDYVSWSGTGALAANTAVPLANGTNGVAGSADHAQFLAALKPYHVDVVIYDGTDASVKSSYADFVKAQSNDEGLKCQAVISDYPTADNECVISVYPQSITLVDGTVLAANEVCWWVGGCEAGANVNESLTYANHPDAADISPKLSGSQQDAAISTGNLAFIAQFEKIQVLTDINTFTSFSTTKGRAFRKNRVVRTVFGLCNDIYKTFALYHIGVTDNNDDGRAALKGEILDLMSRYEGNRALQNVNPDDVTVIKGIDSDAVVIEVYCQPVDSIEKIYVNITIS